MTMVLQFLLINRFVWLPSANGIYLHQIKLKSLAADGSWNQHRTNDVNSDIRQTISDVFAFDETDAT